MREVVMSAGLAYTLIILGSYGLTNLLSKIVNFLYRLVKDACQEKAE